MKKNNKRYTFDFGKIKMSGSPSVSQVVGYVSDFVYDDENYTCGVGDVAYNTFFYSKKGEKSLVIEGAKEGDIFKISYDTGDEYDTDIYVICSDGEFEIIDREDVIDTILYRANICDYD